MLQKGKYESLHTVEEQKQTIRQLEERVRLLESIAQAKKESDRVEELNEDLRK